MPAWANEGADVNIGRPFRVLVYLHGCTARGKKDTGRGWGAAGWARCPSLSAGHAALPNVLGPRVAFYVS